MKNWIGAVAILIAAGPAVAADVATCTLSADKKTVTVTASPSTIAPGQFATITVRVKRRIGSGWSRWMERPVN